MESNPKGRGMFIWQLWNLFGGDYQKMLKFAKYMKLSWVSVKILNGKYKYNWYRDLKYPLGHDLVKELINVFHGSGIEVHGWQWVLMKDGQREGEALVARAKDLGLKGVMMNIEAPCKNAPITQVIKYCQEVADLDIPVGFSSYRYPSYHREIAYEPYLDVCSYISPQVYWIQAHDPVAQLERTIKEYAKLEYGHMPLVPTGAAFTEYGWKPTKQEMIDFNEAVIELKLPGLSWWRFGHAMTLGYYKVIADMPANYGGLPAPDPPPPVENTFFKTKAPLNIRVEASVQSKDVGTLQKGSEVTIIERSGKWGKIRGWVHMDYLEPLS
jgi:hypothetical protein